MLSKSPPGEPVYLGDYTAVVLGADKKSDTQKKIEPFITFRSTESVIRFVGRYLQASDPAALGGIPLFSVVDGRPSGSLVSASVLNQRYSIANDANRRRNMQVLALIQQLLNLHKESADRPLTVPVQVIGGS